MCCDWVLVLGGVLVAVTLCSQMKTAAPYGRHDRKDVNWGSRVNQRMAHILNDGLWGVFFFAALLYWQGVNGAVNVVFVSGWLIHFIHRGIFHPLYMRYSSGDVAVGIPLTGLTLAYFSYIHARLLSNKIYQQSYIYDFRFILGAVLFLVGFIINRWSDVTLRNLRSKAGERRYVIPNVGLFRLVASPNYFGEMIEWLGWAVSLWSTEGLLYFLFTSATFLPRARHNLHWCRERWINYPADRRALIPYLY